ncbi:hypothetical protein G9444_0052 [Rhodococcus erythropolis]|uniref:Uncharacterized protein n=1 Tax=Rhodococcus erythropolis TaxID=1833 RepID=A0A6G9CKS3_RHOER|nr:hypothetical protein [Rhodococcus erythropolis]QIP37296.1 hypothetical protein G9444_0052 [Rhodococcus erythropolis]
MSLALILLALSLGAVFIALGQIVRGTSTQGTYIRLGIFPFVAAACGFFLYVKSRTKARHDPLGPVAGRATHVRTLAIGSASVLVAGAVFAGLALSSESKNSGTQDSTASAAASDDNAIDCQWPRSSPRRRPVVLPAGGHGFSPVAASCFSPPAF